MNKIILKSLQLSNFKGIARYSCGFEDGTNSISASNGEGKSSIKNAWEWCLCQQVDDYLPMLNNKEIPDLITSVEIKLLVNDIEYILRRESRGKYSKDSNNKIKTSNENTYKIDGIELQQKQYQNNLCGIFGVDNFEDIILITDKDYFNTDTTKWKWNDRRKMLFRICNVDNAVADIINKEQYKEIKPYIDKGYATSDIKSMFRKEKEAHKKQQEANLVLIEQKQKEIDEYLGIDFDKLSKDITVAKNKYNRLLSASKKEIQSEKLNELRSKYLELTNELNKLKVEDSKRYNELNSKRTQVYADAIKHKGEYDKLVIDYKQISDELDKLQNNEIEDTCQYCGNKLTQKQIIEKAVEVDKRKDEIIVKKKELEDRIKQERENYNSLLEEYKKSDTEFTKFESDNQIKELETQILDLNSQIEGLKATELNKLSQEDKTNLETQISDLERELAKKDFIIKGNKQVEVWKKESRELADLIINIENKEMQLQNFVKEQTDVIENTVNSHFNNGISWSLYNINYNGSLEESCVCLYNGKRYSSLSAGERNIANMEVVKVLQNYFDVNNPVFSDNHEGITLNYDIDRQVIELNALKGKKLNGCVKITDLY